MCAALEVAARLLCGKKVESRRKASKINKAREIPRRIAETVLTTKERRDEASGARQKDNPLVQQHCCMAARDWTRAA